MPRPRKTAADRAAEAAAAYTAARNDVARLMDVLEMELTKRDAENTTKPHWGKTADLQKTRSDLINAVAFLSGRETTDVQEFLDDAEAAGV